MLYEVITYFDDMVSNIFTGRIQEMVDAKAEGRPVIGTFCVYVPEEIIQAANGVCIGLCGGSQGSVITSYSIHYTKLYEMGIGLFHSAEITCQGYFGIQ